VECVEERCVATAHLAAAALDLHALAAAHHHAVHRFATAAGHHAAHSPGNTLVIHAPLPSSPASGSVTPPGTKGGVGTLHVTLPFDHQDWGVVTLWNNTNTTATFTVSASTFNNGQFYPFALQSGQVRSFFAPVVQGDAPLFQVSFEPGNAHPIPLPNDNIVFESTSYAPAATAGWPYAINLGLGAYSVSPI
jgi:hypothetical protein